MKKILLSFCLSILSLGIVVNAETVEEKATKVDLTASVNEKEIDKKQQATKAAALKDEKAAKGQYVGQLNWTQYPSGYVVGKSYHANGKLWEHVYGYFKLTDRYSISQLNAHTVRYQENGRLRSHYITSKTNIKVKTYSEYRFYHKNGAIASKSIDLYTDGGAARGYKFYDYDTRGRLGRYTVNGSNNKRIYKDERAYYSNNRLKARKVIKYKGNYIQKDGALIKYRNKKGKKRDYFIKGYYDKKGRQKTTILKKYNKAGQLKSNKYGKAYKYRITLKKGYYYIVGKVTRAKYNKKGNLSGAVSVKPSKFTLKILLY